MSWLVPSLIATLAGTFILSLVYLHLYRVERERYLGIWSLSWAMHSFRFASMLVMVLWAPSHIFMIINQLSALWSGLLLLWGTLDFIGRRISRNWTLLGILITSWIISAALLHVPFPLLTLPTFIILGSIFIWTGFVLLNFNKVRGLSTALGGWTFIIWGIHKIDYPFLGQAAWFAPWGYLLGAMLELTAAISILLMYFEKARTEARRERDFLDRIMEASPTGIAALDRNGNIFFANRRAEQILGVPRAEALHRTYNSAEWHITDPDGAPFPEENFPFTVIGRTGKPVFGTQFGIEWPNGKRVLLSVNAVPRFGKSGKLDSVVTSFEDITEHERTVNALKESEERYRVTFDHAAVGICNVSLEGRLLHFNRRLCDILGYSPEELSTLGLRDVTHPDDLQGYQEQLNLLLKGDISTYLMEMRYLRRDSSMVWAHLTASLMRKPNGDPNYLIAIVEDITDRKKGDQERAKLEMQLQQTQKMEAIGTLAGGIAHDFNNILTAILGYAELTMEDLPEKGDLRHNMTRIVQAGQRAKELIQQILAFSRQSVHELKPVRIGPVVTEALKLLRATLPSTIEISWNQEPETGAVMADSTQIHQVLMNLCTNAAHAMQDRGGVLEVSLKRVDVDAIMSTQKPDLGPGPYLQLSVADTGHGMSPEVMARIFEPFYTTKTRGEGTGMGLAVVHGIIKSHHGSISVYSEEGTGTTFHVYLPVISSDTQTPPGPAHPLPRGSESILFVDDEEPLADLGKHLLERLGYRVETSVKSLEALEMFRMDPDRYDLMITDQTMPGITGVELAKEAMRIKPGFPVILCTGFSTSITPERAQALGIRAMIMKPVVMREMAETIRRVLDGGK